MAVVIRVLTGRDSEILQIAVRVCSRRFVAAVQVDTQVQCDAIKQCHRRAGISADRLQKAKKGFGDQIVRGFGIAAARQQEFPELCCVQLVKATERLLIAIPAVRSDEIGRFAHSGVTN
jgi:hypothetical protein